MPVEVWTTKKGDRFQEMPIELLKGDRSVRNFSGDNLTPANIFIHLTDTNDASRKITDNITTIVNSAVGQISWRPTAEAVRVPTRWLVEIEIVHPTTNFRESFPVLDTDVIFMDVKPDIGDG